MATGRYINSRLSLCHKPSLAIGVFENSSLSDITKSVKNTKDSTKHAMLIAPVTLLPLRNERIPMNKGTKRKSMNPMTDPAPWIFDAAVTMSLDSLTLKKQVKIQEPTAKAVMKLLGIPWKAPELR